MASGVSGSVVGVLNVHVYVIACMSTFVNFLNLYVRTKR